MDACLIRSRGARAAGDDARHRIDASRAHARAGVVDDHVATHDGGQSGQGAAGERGVDQVVESDAALVALDDDIARGDATGIDRSEGCVAIQGTTNAPSCCGPRVEIDRIHRCVVGLSLHQYIADRPHLHARAHVNGCGRVVGRATVVGA